MTRQELEHAIRAACDVAGDSEVYVFGSQSILGSHPNAPAELRQSAEADIVPKNFPERSIIIDGALGELSTFHRTHGFYVHGISMETAILPRGWEQRCVPVRNANTRNYLGLCLEGHDLALSKLAAFRPKDRSFVRVLMKEGLVDAGELLARLSVTPVSGEVHARIESWLEATRADLGAE